MSIEADNITHGTSYGFRQIVQTKEFAYSADTMLKLWAGQAMQGILVSELALTPGVVADKALGYALALQAAFEARGKG